MLNRLNSWRRSASNTATPTSPPLKPPKPSPTTTLHNETSKHEKPTTRIAVREEVLSEPSTSLEADSGYLLEWGRRNRGKSILLFEDVSLASDEDDGEDEEDDEDEEEEELMQTPPEEPSPPPSVNNEVSTQAPVTVQEDKRQGSRRQLFSLPSMSLPSFSSGLPPPPPPPAPTPITTEERQGADAHASPEATPTEASNVPPPKPIMPPRTNSFGARFMPTLLKKVRCIFHSNCIHQPVTVP